MLKLPNLNNQLLTVVCIISCVQIALALPSVIRIGMEVVFFLLSFVFKSTFQIHLKKICKN